MTQSLQPRDRFRIFRSSRSLCRNAADACLCRRWALVHPEHRRARLAASAAVSFGGRASGAVVVGAALLLAGCPSAQRRPAFQWKTAAITRPIIPAPFSASDGTLPEVTSVESVPAPPSLHIVPVRVPPRPRVPASSATPAENGKADGPLIVPQMSAGESAAAQQEISSSLAAADRNLDSVRGKALNAAQSDMANKAKGFINDAREAARSGDWARARSLAKKAQVLSEELARSL